MKNKKAFTLIELLVVIAIIGIIATIAIVALQQARQNARDAKRVADVKQMSTALEMYFNEHQAYPESLDDLKEAGYMQMLPEAPTPADKGCEDSNDYFYSISENRDFYHLRFCTGKQVADLSPGNLCMTPGGLTTKCSEEGSSVVSCSNYTTGSGECEYEGQIYKIVQIGNQTWFAENLNYDNDCSEVPFETLAYNDNGWCGYYGNNKDSYEDYGLLYQWSTAMNGSTVEGSQGICPPNWHIPTVNDRDALFDYLSSDSQYWCDNNPGYIAKALAHSSGWKTTSVNCSIGNEEHLNNKSGFGLLPGGKMYSSRGHGFGFFGDGAYVWTSSFHGDSGSVERKSFSFSHGVADIGPQSPDRDSSALSVRCLKN